MGLMGGDFNLMNAALSFVHLDDDCGLVVTVGVKKLGLLGGDDGSHEGSHQQSQVTLKLLNYHGQWGNIQQKQMLGPILEPSTTPEERGGEEKKKKKTHESSTVRLYSRRNALPKKDRGRKEEKESLIPKYLIKMQNLCSQSRAFFRHFSGWVTHPVQ